MKTQPLEILKTLIRDHVRAAPNAHSGKVLPSSRIRVTTRALEERLAATSISEMRSTMSLKGLVRSAPPM